MNAISVSRARAWLPALLLSGLACAGQAAAQSYPTRVVRYIVPFTSGSGADTLARIVTGGLGDVFGRQVVVDNRGGAAGNIGAEIASRAPADGYTIMQGNLPLATNASLYPRLPYDLLRDFAAVTEIASSPQMLVVHPSLPARSLGDLLRLAKSQPGAIAYSSAGAGSTTHLSMEILRGMARIDLLHVPYRGGAEAVVAVIAGETAAAFLPAATALPQVRQDKLRLLAVSTAKRLPSLPQIPTVSEAGVPGYEFTNWYGLMVPAKTPRDIIAAIHAATVTALNKPDVRKRLVGLYYDPVGNTPEEFSAYVQSEVARLGKLIRAFHLTAR